MLLCPAMIPVRPVRALALGLVFILAGCRYNNERKYRQVAEATCAQVAISSLNEGKWSLGARHREYLIDMAAARRNYLDTGKDTPAAELLNQYAPAYMSECVDWVVGRGLLERCGGVPAGTPDAAACWSSFFNSSPGNDLDWVIALAKVNAADINEVVPGSWLRASREIDLCGREGCSAASSK